MFTQDYSLTLQMPKCNPFAEKASAKAFLNDDLTEVLAYLNAEVPGAIYSPDVPAIMLSRLGHHVTIRPQEILVGGVTGEEEAREVLESVRALVNDVWARRDEIEPDYRGREPLSAMDALKLLPKTNCRECGEVACLPFAVKLVAREALIADCAPLFTPEHADSRKTLIGALAARGYEVPAECP